MQQCSWWAFNEQIPRRLKIPMHSSDPQHLFPVKLWFNLNFYHQIAQKLCKILNISIKATFDMQIYLKNSYELIKKIEGSLIY